LAQKIVYSAFELIEKQTKLAAIDVFKTALENIKPQVELKVKRVAGSNIQQPTKVRPERQITLALR
jgi:small subunit ribosomal protein S7